MIDHIYFNEMVFWNKFASRNNTIGRFTAILLVALIFCQTSAAMETSESTRKSPGSSQLRSSASSPVFSLPYNNVSKGTVFFPDEVENDSLQSRTSKKPSRHRILYGVAAQRYTPAISRQVCELFPDRGPCNGRTGAWFWDSIKQKCRTFMYGGCRGNGNNFITERECRSVCDEVYRHHVLAESGQDPDKYSIRLARVKAVKSSHSAPYKGQAILQPIAQPLLSTDRYSSAGQIDRLYSDTNRYSSTNKYGKKYSPSVSNANIVKLASSVKSQGCRGSDDYCDTTSEDYPSQLVTEVVRQYSHQLQTMYQQLYPDQLFIPATNSTSSARARVADDLSRHYESGQFVCESEVKYSSPGWARTLNGQWQIVLNAPKMPQAVRTEVCRYTGSRCNFLPPCMQSVCVQRYAVVKLLCINPLNLFRLPSVQNVRIPSGCSCFLPNTSGSSNNDPHHSHNQYDWQQPWARTETTQKHAQDPRTSV